jgi:hypothetical protein
MSLAGKKLKERYSSLLNLNVENTTGISDHSLHTIKDGIGTESSLAVSTTKVLVTPLLNSSATLLVETANGEDILSVDTGNKKVLVNSGQSVANTAIKTFQMSDGSPLFAGTHSPISAYSHNSMSGSSSPTLINFGSSANPIDTVTITSNAYQYPNVLWRPSSNLKLESMDYAIACNDASTINIHLMQYDIVAGSGSTAGDLSNGTCIALTGSGLGSLSPVTVGDDRISTGYCTLLSTDLPADKAYAVCIENVGTTGDVTIVVNLQYYIK